MKYVVNTTYGAFHLPTRFAEEDGRISVFDVDSYDRVNPALISWIEDYPHESPWLSVVEIPAQATDWELDEYDGMEHIIAVVDGKLVHLY